MEPDAIARIELALLKLVRRANDPRANRRVNAAAGVDVEIERAGSVMLARVEELEPVRLSDLAEAIGVDASTASRQVARLVDCGLVRREPDPHDGRATVHRLTPAGRDVRIKIVDARRAWFTRVLEDFDEAERESLAGLFERFVHHLEAVQPRTVEVADRSAR